MTNGSMTGTSWLNPTNRFLTDLEIVSRMHIPSVPAQVPRILGWSGPGRSGTTALLMLLAGHPSIDAVYFQPLKTLLRSGGGGPDFRLSSRDDLVCTKEVFGPMFSAENFDPVGLLLRAGVPADRITWLSVLRAPVDAFSSWRTLEPRITPDHYAESQRHTLKLHLLYTGLGVKMIPFAYDLFDLGVEPILEALIAATELGINPRLSSAFDLSAITRKVVWGQADDPAYYDRAVAPTLTRGRFSYRPGTKRCSPREQAALNRLCLSGYKSFLALSAQALSLA